MHRFLDDVASHVLAFHLSDNDGTADQNRPFDERAWFIPWLGDFSNAVMVLEAYNLEISEIRANCAVIERAHQHAH